MSPAIASSLGIVFYLALFAAVGVVFLFVNLLVGKLVRPHDPNADKLEIYECGEPTIGSSFVQFDLRFYVVALVFIVFDVEVAFLFPLSTVFGKATHFADPAFDPVVQTAPGEPVMLTPEAVALYGELGVAQPTPPAAETWQAAELLLQAQGQTLAWVAFAAINVFFVILLVGFAYEWKTGAFDWVRAIQRSRKLQIQRAPPAPIHEEQPAVPV